MGEGWPVVVRPGALSPGCRGYNPGGGGGDSNIKMPRCVCLVTENISIMNATLSCKTYPYWRDSPHNSYPFLMVI